MKTKLVYSQNLVLNTEYYVHSIFKKVVNITDGVNLYALIGDLNFYSNHSIYFQDFIYLKKNDVLIFNEFGYFLNFEFVKCEIEVKNIELVKLENKQFLFENLNKIDLKIERKVFEEIQNKLNEKIISTKYLGLGNGLTPEIDDLILGLIYIDKVLNLNYQIEEIDFLKTTEISYYMLKNGIYKSFYECFVKLIIQSNNEDKMVRNTIKFIENIGATSGRFMLFGMYLMLKKEITNVY